MEALPALFDPAVGLGGWDPLAARALRWEELSRLRARARGAPRGRLLRLLGEPGALSELDRALRSAPGHARARAWRAELRLQDEPRRALADLERAGSVPAARLYRGAALARLGRWREAGEAFRSWEEAGGDAGLAAALSGAALARTGAHEEALRAYARAGRRGFAPAALDWLRALSLSGAGRSEDARGAVDAALEKFPELDPLDALIGGGLGRESRASRAVSGRTMRLLHRAVGRGRRRAWALALRAETRRAPQFLQYRLAAEDYRRAARLEPGTAWIQACLGRALVGTGSYREALRALDRAAGLKACGWILAWRGECRRRLGAPGALKDLDRAARLSPEYPFARAWRGAALRQAGRLTEAARELEVSLRLIPGYEWSLGELFETRKAQGRPAEAAALLTRAFERDPKFTWWRGGDPEAVSGELAAAVRKVPASGELRAWLAWARLNARDLEGAAEALGRGAEGSAFEHFVRAELEAARGGPRRALAGMERAVRARRAGPYLAGRGMLLTRLGRWREAVRDLEAAAALNETTAQYHAALAAAYVGLGRSKDAVARLDTALGICPDYAQAREFKRRVLMGAAA